MQGGVCYVLDQACADMSSRNDAMHFLMQSSRLKCIEVSMKKNDDKLINICEDSPVVSGWHTV